MPIPLPALLLSRPGALALALQDAAPETTEAPGGLFGPGNDFWILMIAIVAIFYFVMIVPEKKQRKRREAMLQALRKGDRVMTTSGMFGSVAQVQEDVVTLQVADGVRMRFTRSAIQTVLEEPKEKEAEAKGS